MENEGLIRVLCFVAIFLGVAMWERLTPRRALSQPVLLRWFNNLGIVVIDTVLLRLLFPLAAVGMAILAEERQWGLLNNFSVPPWLAIVLSVIVFDFVIYLQHVMFHAVPALWRLHMVHHTDLDYDLTTGIRFHPLEILLSMLIKLATVAVIGPPAVAVIVFEVLLNGTAMFNHGNILLPGKLDRALRLVIVTPDMHRVHHSIIKRETNSNYGFNLSWWDRLFGTYRAQPQLGHDKMTIGLEQYRDQSLLNLWHLLKLPFSGQVGKYPINRE
jgi:sterol desaturase/sphingolipid hydroxylase (fatty acid hydroxylase superfamily)